MGFDGCVPSETSVSCVEDAKTSPAAILRSIARRGVNRKSALICLSGDRACRILRTWQRYRLGTKWLMKRNANTAITDHGSIGFG